MRRPAPGNRGLPQVGEELLHGFGLAGEDEVGAEVGEGLEDEEALVGAAMGDDEAHLVEGLVAVVDDVEVEGAGGVDFADGGAAAGDFEVFKGAEQIEGGEFDAFDNDFGDGVKEGGRAGGAVDGLGFEVGTRENVAVVGEGAEEGEAGVEFLGAVAKVGAEGDADRDEHGWKGKGKKVALGATDLVQ